MSKWMVILFAILAGCKAQAQTEIKGRIISVRKKPLAGVNISIKDSYEGATSDSSGSFSFVTEEKGIVVLQAEQSGYKLYQQQINVTTAPAPIEIILKELVDEMSAVVITAGAFEASDRKKATVLNPIDIVTTASGNGDVTGALKTLPGAQQVGESEGLFVRGGTAAETKTFIDGNLVNNFFFSSVPNVAQRGRFSPFLFKGTVFSTGGYSALYGQALSSALILESIDLPDQTSANLGVTVIGASGGYQHLDKNKKYSFGGSYSYTNLSLAFSLIKQQQDYEQVPVFNTADANFRIKTSKTGIIKYYGIFGKTNLKFYTPSLDSIGYLDGFALKNTNFYHNLYYRESFGRWKMNAGLAYTDNRDRIESGLYSNDKELVTLSPLEFKNFKLDNTGKYLNAKLVLERKFAGLNAVRFGSEFNRLDDHSLFTNHLGNSFEQEVKESITAAFAETDLYITNGLAAKLGGRLEHSKLMDKVNAAPRVSLAYKLSKQGQVSFAYGKFYQNPERQFFPTSADLRFTNATHYILQYQRVTKLTTLRTELFYKKYDDLIKTDLQNFQPVAIGNQGFGDAQGIEIFWRDKQTIKDVDYWISYSYLDTKRDFLNFPSAIQPNFAAKHTASLVVKKFVTPWKTQFNAAYNYASGRPYYFIAPENGSFKFTDRGVTPDYHNVSFSVNYLPSLGKKDAKSFAVYVFSVSNVFGFDQVFNYQYSYHGLRKTAIVPPSKVFVFVGAFISFGIDRSQDVINNNL
jgi:vitamin B12 transporter